MASVVIADDEHPIRLILAAKLREEGHQVTECRDGDEALDAVLENCPDLLITDFQMPVMSGLALCMTLKTNPRTASLPVLMLTARGHAISPQELAMTNIRHLLPKPFSAKQIVERVRAILEVPPSAAAA
ncbi:MAG: response regulator [Phycisphaerales bacterium]|nr:response regulator [Phycisphaerales bacterium]